MGTRKSGPIKAITFLGWTSSAPWASPQGMCSNPSPITTVLQTHIASSFTLWKTFLKSAALFCSHYLSFHICFIIYHFKLYIEEHVLSLGIFFSEYINKKSGKSLKSFSAYLIHYVYTSSFIPQMIVFTEILNHYVNELCFFLHARNVQETDNEAQVWKGMPHIYLHEI